MEDLTFKLITRQCKISAQEPGWWQPQTEEKYERLKKTELFQFLSTKSNWTNQVSRDYLRIRDCRWRFEIPDYRKIWTEETVSMNWWPNVDHCHSSCDIFKNEELGRKQCRGGPWGYIGDLGLFLNKKRVKGWLVYIIKQWQEHCYALWVLSDRQYKNKSIRTKI